MHESVAAFALRAERPEVVVWRALAGINVQAMEQPTPGPPAQMRL